MSESLKAFRQQGLLPFVGREAEVERLVRFWCDPDRRRGQLEVMLTTGEAGIGKTRLLEETRAAIERRGGAVIGVRLRPEGGASLAHLLLDAIERSGVAGPLFSGSATLDLSTAVGRLRRLCALRRTLVTIDDVHLLSGGTLRDAALILESLRDEPIAILATARPIDFPARAILDLYLCQDTRLLGLEPDDIRSIWHDLFPSELGSEALDALTEATRGNPLAIRAALWSGLRVGLFGGIDAEEGKPIGGNLAPFRETLFRSRHALIEGMTADLDDDLLAAARRLAVLGEAFSREAAALVVDDAERTISRLLESGLLVTTTMAVTVVNGRESTGLPIAFTHSLLHDELVRSASPMMEDLVRLIAAGPPILSFLPYKKLAGMLGQNAPDVSRIDHNVLVGAVAECCATARLLNTTSDWQRASLPMGCAEHLFEILREVPTAADLGELEAGVLLARLELLYRASGMEAREGAAYRLYDLAQTLPGIEGLALQLRGLEHIFRWHEDHYDLATCGEVAEKVHALVADHPELRGRVEYLSVLHVIANRASAMADHAALRRIETIVEGVLADESIPARQRRDLHLRMAGYFLDLIGSRAELELRTNVVRELDREHPPLSLHVPVGALPYYWQRQSFLMCVGRLHECLDQSGVLQMVAERHGLAESYATQVRLGLACRAFLTGDVEAVLDSARSVKEWIANQGDVAERQRYEMRRRLGRSLHTIGILLGDIVLMRIAVNEFCHMEGDLHVSNHLLHLAWEGRWDEFHAVSRALPAGLHPLVDAFFDVPVDEEWVAGQYLAQFRHHEYDLFTFQRYFLAIALVERGAQRGRIAIDEPLREAIRGALAHVVELLLEQRIPRCAAPILDRYGAWIADDVREGLRARTEAILADEVAARQSLEGVLTISMFDTIRVRRGANPPERLRGPRGQLLLGLLVANRMVRRPLERTEFFRLASGVDDREKARTATHVAVLRLREAIGKKAVATGGEIPELNEEDVRVDILEILHDLRSAEQDLRRGRVVEARERCDEIVARGAGRVAFPGLYEEIFEGLRDDLENRMRELVRNVARRLLEAEDYSGAEDVLAGWIERMPDDDDVIAMLADALRRGGREGEATVVMQRSAETRGPDAMTA